MKRISILCIIIAMFGGNIAFAQLDEQKINKIFFELVNKHRKNLNLKTALWSDKISQAQKDWSTKNLVQFRNKLNAYASKVNASYADSANLMNEIINNAHAGFAEQRLPEVARQLYPAGGNIKGREICHFTFILHNKGEEQQVAEEIFKAFLNSPGHKAAIEKISTGTLLMGTGTVIIENRLYTATMFVETKKDCL